MINEKSVENYFKARAKSAGFLVRKAQWVGHNHCPDRILMTKALTVWVELKAPGKVARGGQLREHERMRKAGQHVVVIDNKDDVNKLINYLRDLNMPEYFTIACSKCGDNHRVPREVVVSGTRSNCKKCKAEEQ